MIKICLIAIVALILGIQFKSLKNEYAVYIGIIASLIILTFAIDKMEDIMNMLEEFQKYINIDNKYIKMLFKIIGITYIAEFTAAICKDGGYASIGKQIEMAGKLSVLVVSMPLFVSLVETLTSL